MSASVGDGVGDVFEECFGIEDDDWAGAVWTPLGFGGVSMGVDGACDLRVEITAEVSVEPFGVMEGGVLVVAQGDMGVEADLIFVGVVGEGEADDLVNDRIRSQMTPVPLSGPEISGLINLRGAIVTAIDLRRRLRLPDRPEGQLPMNVVVRDQDGAVSLLVDEIGDVLEVHRGQYETAPDNLDPHVRDAISGVYKLPGQLLLALDHKIATEV